MTSSRLETKGNKPAATCNVEVEEKENSCQSAERTKVRSAIQIRNSGTYKKGVANSFQSDTEYEIKTVNFWFCLLCIQRTPSRLLWRYKVGAHSVHFSDTPFAIGEKSTLDCQYSKRYYKTKEHSSNHVYLQGT